MKAKPLFLLMLLFFLSNRTAAATAGQLRPAPEKEAVLVTLPEIFAPWVPLLHCGELLLAGPAGNHKLEKRILFTVQTPRHQPGIT